LELFTPVVGAVEKYHKQPGLAEQAEVEMQTQMPLDLTELQIQAAAEAVVHIKALVMFTILEDQAALEL
jgi:hypothetical protein